MHNCTFCGVQLPDNARFCGRCGRMQSPETAKDHPTPSIQRPDINDAEERRRRSIPPFLPLPGAPMGAGQSNVPMVQGIPQASGVPIVQGTPQANVPPMMQAPPSISAASNPPVAPHLFHSAAPSASPPSVSAPSQFPARQLHPPQHPHAWGPPAYEPHTHPHHPAPSHPGMRSKKSQAVRLHGSTAKGALFGIPKGLIIVITGIVILGTVSAGIAAYLLTGPQPVISASSDYKVGTSLAGASGTVLHVSGQKFSSSSAITFLLDGIPTPGKRSVNSDANGNFRVDLAITDGWSLGKHTLTARDAGNHTTPNGVTVLIVPQGQANTPGPMGAPPDDASFMLNVTIQAQLDPQGNPVSSHETVIITGHPDPRGGTVCQTEDDGQPHTFTGVGVLNGLPYRHTAVYSCSGTYKGGKLTLTETLISDTAEFVSNGALVTCTFYSPQVDERLSGSYIGQHTFSGTATYPLITTYRCNQPGASFYGYAAHGTWSGPIISS